MLRNKTGLIVGGMLGVLTVIFVNAWTKEGGGTRSTEKLYSDKVTVWKPVWETFVLPEGAVGKVVHIVTEQRTSNFPVEDNPWKNMILTRARNGKTDDLIASVAALPTEYDRGYVIVDLLKGLGTLSRQHCNKLIRAGKRLSESEIEKYRETYANVVDYSDSAPKPPSEDQPLSKPPLQEGEQPPRPEPAPPTGDDKAAAKGHTPLVTRVNFNSVQAGMNKKEIAEETLRLMPLMQADIWLEQLKVIVSEFRDINTKSAVLAQIAEFEFNSPWASRHAEETSKAALAAATQAYDDQFGWWATVGRQWGKQLLAWLGGLIVFLLAALTSPYLKALGIDLAKKAAIPTGHENIKENLKER